MHYSYMWWADGLRSQTRTVCIQNDRYVAAVSSRSGLPVRFAALDSKREEIRCSDNTAVFSSPVLACGYQLHVGDTTYTLTEDDAPVDRTRTLEQGALVQHFDCMGLTYLDRDGARAPVFASNDFLALPEKLVMTARFVPERILSDLLFEASYTFAGSCTMGEDGVLTVEQDSGKKFCVRVSDSHARPELRGNTLYLKASWDISTPGYWQSVEAGNSYYMQLELYPENQYCDPQVSVEVTEPYQVKLTAEQRPGYPKTGYMGYQLCNHSAYYDAVNNPGMQEKIRIHLSNPTEQNALCTLSFRKDCNYAGTPGLIPTMHDPDGTPNGIFVQLCKNWHNIPGCIMPEQGPWLHLFTCLELPAHTERDYELRLSFAQLGEVHPASHAQLCLVGWGGNHLWDQCALGCFGESITYDPDVGLHRCVIDDVRPMFVRGMGKHNCAKWAWTQNVGGNDFLVYYDEKGEKQFLSNMKVSYFSQGPLITDVNYTGFTADGAIKADMKMQTCASTDMNRCFHTFRYEALRDIRPQRLAFYQMGADHYNNHAFKHTAVGDLTGKTAEYDGMKGEYRYHRKDIPLSADNAWISFHGQIKGFYYDGVAQCANDAGAIANRGLIVRSYRAVLNGQVYDAPTGAIYGTCDEKCPSSNFELSLPAGITELHKGDVIEGMVEYMIPPQFVDDYYESNQNLRRVLEQHPDSWEVVCREAVLNALEVQVRRGSLVRRYPLEVAAENNTADFTVRGGTGYVPFTMTGLTRYTDVCLYEDREGVLKPVDATGQMLQVQLDTITGLYKLTWVAELDTAGDRLATRHFVLK